MATTGAWARAGQRWLECALANKTKVAPFLYKMILLRSRYEHFLQFTLLLDISPIMRAAAAVCALLATSATATAPLFAWSNAGSRFVPSLRNPR